MDQRTRFLIALCAGALLSLATVAHAAPPWKQEYEPSAEGREAFEHGSFDEALKKFEALDDQPGLNDEDRKRAAFNRGAALYQLQRFKEAEQEFDRAATANDPALRADAYYNRGLAQEGGQAAAKAIDSYRKALLANPAHEPARVNLEKLLQQPPQPQPQQQQRQNAQQDRQQDDEQRESQPQPQSADENDGEQEQQAQSGQDQQEPQEQQQARSDGQDEKEQDGREGAGRELSQKEADDILRAAEQESKGGRLMHSGKPPRDYDPSREW